MSGLKKGFVCLLLVLSNRGFSQSERIDYCNMLERAVDDSLSMKIFNVDKKRNGPIEILLLGAFSDCEGIGKKCKVEAAFYNKRDSIKSANHYYEIGYHLNGPKSLDIGIRRRFPDDAILTLRYVYKKQKWVCIKRSNGNY